MNFDINEALGSVLNEKASREKRMVKLYEFEVAIRFCDGHARDREGSSEGSPEAQALVGEDGFCIAVDPEVVRQARLFAVMRLLRQETEDIGMAIERPYGRAGRILSMFKDGTWDDLMNHPSASSFNSQIGSRYVVFQRAAKVADFSFRVDPVKPQHGGGRTMAVNILEEEEGELSAGVRATVIREAIDSFEPVLGFALLILQEKYDYWPRGPAHPGLLTHLRNAVEKRDELVEFIGKHNYVAKFLRTRGYDVPLITIDGGRPEQMVGRVPLDAATMVLVENYRS